MVLNVRQDLLSLLLAIASFVIVLLHFTQLCDQLAELIIQNGSMGICVDQDIGLHNCRTYRDLHSCMQGLTDQPWS